MLCHTKGRNILGQNHAAILAIYMNFTVFYWLFFIIQHWHTQTDAGRGQRLLRSQTGKQLQYRIWYRNDLFVVAGQKTDVVIGTDALDHTQQALVCVQIIKPGQLIGFFFRRTQQYRTNNQAVTCQARPQVEFTARGNHVYFLNNQQLALPPGWPVQLRHAGFVQFAVGNPTPAGHPGFFHHAHCIQPGLGYYRFIQSVLFAITLLI